MTITLCDTSPLVALINRKDSNHARALAALKTLRGALVTTWPCVADYRVFNTRDLEAALATMHPEVEWPNTMQGGYVQGHEGVRAYWSKQWNLVDPHVDPLRFATDVSGRIVIDVHQVVHDLEGHLLEDLMVQHIYRIVEGLIRRMEMGEDRLMTTAGDRMESA